MSVIDYSALDTSLSHAQSEKESDALLQELAIGTGKNLYGAWTDYQDFKVKDLLDDKFIPQGGTEEFDIYERGGNWFSDLFSGYKGRLDYSPEYLEHLDAGTLPEGLDVVDLSKRGLIKGNMGGKLKNFFGNLPKNKPMETYKMSPTSAAPSAPRKAGITKYNMDPAAPSGGGITKYQFGPKGSTNINPSTQGITKYSGGNVVPPTSGVSAPGITKYVGGEPIAATSNTLKGVDALSKVGDVLDVAGPIGNIAGIATTNVDALTGKLGDTAAAKSASGVAGNVLGAYAAASPEPFTKTMAGIGSLLLGAGSV